MDDLASFIAAGNTQVHRTMPLNPRVHPPVLSPRLVSKPFSLSCATQPGGFYNGGSTLQSGFAEQSQINSSCSEQQHEQEWQQQQQQPQLKPWQQRRPQQRAGAWEVTDEMMGQKWSTVLRTLQPSALNDSSAAPRAQLPVQAPAFLTGKAYTPRAAQPSFTPRPVLPTPTIALRRAA